MFKHLRNLCILISIAVLALAHAASAHAARYALLIGNDSYQSVPALRNARADAEAMGAALQKAGYTVTVMQDRNLKEMKDDVREFKSLIKGGDEVFFFYSGHGVQIEAMNYLLPVDVRADSEDQVRDDALALSTVLSDLRAQKPALTLAVVDACRDNPFKGTGRAIGGRGLTGVGGANGQMVIYSAGEGQQALDRLSDGDPIRNGLFTRVFMEEMQRPGVPIDQVARQVRAEVNRQALSVKHEQVPAIYDQVIGQYYFYAQNDAGVDEVELVFWTSIKDSSDPAELKAYLDKYPDGQFSGLAQARIKRLEQNQGIAEKVPVAKTAHPSAKEDAPATMEPPQPAVAEGAVKQEAAEGSPAISAPATDSPAAVPEQLPALLEVPSTPAVEKESPPPPEPLAESRAVVPEKSKLQPVPEQVDEETPELLEITPADNENASDAVPVNVSLKEAMPASQEQSGSSSQAPDNAHAPTTTAP